MILLETFYMYVHVCARLRTCLVCLILYKFIMCLDSSTQLKSRKVPLPQEYLQLSFFKITLFSTAVNSLPLDSARAHEITWNIHIVKTIQLYCMEKMRK